MKIVTRRCQNCNQTYGYHISGYAGSYNNKDYCPECYAVIIEALKLKRGPAYHHKRVTEPYPEIPDDIAKKIDSLDNSRKEALKDSILKAEVYLMVNLPDLDENYNIVRAVIDGCTYFRAIHKDNKFDVRYFVDKEYVFNVPNPEKLDIDTLNELLHKKESWDFVELWKVYSDEPCKDSIMCCHNHQIFKDYNRVPVQPMSPPSGRINYMDALFKK